MRFLTDQDVYAVTVRFLRDLGHDVATAYELGLSKADDSHLLNVALEQDRVFVTRDRDFGALVFVEDLGSGVVYLRVQPKTINAVHQMLKEILSTHTDQELRCAFYTVEPGRYRRRTKETG